LPRYVLNKEDVLLFDAADDPGGCAERKASRGNYRLRAYNGTCADDGPFTYFGSVKDDRPDADEGTPAHMAPMDDNAMTEHDVIFENNGVSPFHNMDDAPILDVASRADADIIRVAAHGALKPYVGAGTYLDVPYYRSIIDNESGWIDLRIYAAKRNDHVCSPVPSSIFEKWRTRVKT
jgi:hypothetical protein